MAKNQIIGIVGGVGPYAGLDLNEKIFSQTIATKDQDHLDIILLSYSSHIPDRTEYLIGKVKENPSEGIYKALNKLELAGANIAGIPCNTAYSSKIWDQINLLLAQNKNLIKLVNMIEETAIYIKKHLPKATKIGILGTTGTINSDVYGKVYKKKNLEVIYPDQKIQSTKVHDAIYNTDYGIKAYSKPVTEKAVARLKDSIKHLVDKDVQVIILGCTEIPLAIKETHMNGVPLIDATLILARSLIEKVAPNKLKPVNF